MKKFMLVLALVLTAGQEVALSKNKLPRLVEVRLSEIMPLTEVSPTSSLAMLPTTVLQESGRDALRKSIRNTREVFACAGLALCSMGSLAAVIHGATTLVSYALYFPEVPGNQLLVVGTALLGGGMLGLGFSNQRVTAKIEAFSAIKPALGRIEEAIANNRNLAIYKSDDAYRVGMLSNAGEEFTIVDAQGSEAAVKPEQLVQLLAIGDELPRDVDRSINVLSNKLRQFLSYIMIDFRSNLYLNSSTAISADFTDSYRGATLAFTYKGKNHLGTITGVNFAPDGQGELVVAIAEGDELTITSNKLGKPVVIDPHTDKKHHLRGVVFVP